MLFKEREYNMDVLEQLNREIIEISENLTKNKEDKTPTVTHMELFSILSFIKERKQEIGRIEERIIRKLENMLKKMEKHNVN